MSDELDEIRHTLRRLQDELEDLTVGGLRAVGPERLPMLEALGEDFGRIGAAHLAERLKALTEGIRADRRDAAGALLRTKSSLRLFERILTLRTVESRFAALAGAGEIELEEDLDEDLDDDRDEELP